MIALRAQVAVGVGLEARFVFAAFAGVRLAADAVHGDRQRLVRFLADRAERHRAGGEALDDLLRRLDFLERNRLRRDFLNSIRPRSVQSCRFCLSIRSVYSWNVCEALLRAPRAAAC